MPQIMHATAHPVLINPGLKSIALTPMSPCAANDATLRLTHWTSSEPASSQTLETSASGHILSLCLRATHLELRSSTGTPFDGVMRAGAVHVIGPGQRVTAWLKGPCDLLHLHVSTLALRARMDGMGAPQSILDQFDGYTVSDPLTEQLARLLLSEAARSDEAYATAIAQTLLTRILHLAQNRTPGGALAKWRLRRVQALVEAQLGESLTLRDMAAAAGLSRMHFAAQFRAATGSSPHEYLLCRRVETAKTLMAKTETSLAEIALEVGFLAQAHFTTVFKRLVGETPARWRRGDYMGDRRAPGKPSSGENA